MQTKLIKTLFIGSIIVLVGIASYNFYLYDNLLKTFGQNKILTFSINHPEFLHTENSYIANTVRSDYVFPNDRLIYKTSLMNDAKYDIDIENKIEVLVGGKAIHENHFEKFTLSTETSDSLSNEFYVNGEGTHEVVVNLKIFNSSNQEALSNTRQVFRFQVLSETIKLQQDSNFFTVIGIVTSSIVASVAASFLGYQTLQSRSERNQMMRPWIGMDSNQMEILSYIDTSDNEKTEDEIRELNKNGKKFNWNKIRRSFELKNYGQLPALDVKCRSRIFIGKEPELKEINNAKLGTDSIVFPNGTHPFIFIFTKQMEDAMANANTDVFYLFETQYTSTNSKKIHKIGLLLKLDAGHYTVMKNWNETNAP